MCFSKSEHSATRACDVQSSETKDCKAEAATAVQSWETNEKNWETSEKKWETNERKPGRQMKSTGRQMKEVGDKPAGNPTRPSSTKVTIL